MKPVSLSRCRTYDRAEVEAAVFQAMERLGGFGAFVSAGEKVLVKPNLLVGAAPDKSVSTHPEVMRAVVRGCQAVGAEVWVGDSPGFGDPARVAERCGIMAICRDTGARFVPLSEPVVTPYPEGRVVKSFALARGVVEADRVISVAKFKTHGLMLYTGAVKNLYGCIAGLEKMRMHVTYQSPAQFARMLIDLYGAVSPSLSIVDAVVGMEGPGPRSGDSREMGLIMAGADGFGVDLAAGAVIDIAPERIPLLAALAERDPEAVRLDRLPVLGLSLEEARVSGFRVPEHLHATNMPKWVEDFARQWTTAKPVVIPDLCVACGVCRDACPAGAIRIEDKRAWINDDKCIRCYCCQEMCPEGAIELRRNRLSRLLPWR